MSNKNQNYNKLSDEQQQATYEYPKANESEINRQNNQLNSSVRQGQSYNDFPMPQSYPYYQDNASYIPRNSPPQSYLSNNQQQAQYPMPNNNAMAQPQVLIFQQNQPRHDYENQVEGEMEIGNRNPVDLICPNCGRHVQTFIKHKSGLGTNFVALILCFAAGSICLCILPYLINRCKDAVHYCPSCGHRVGTSSFLC